MIGFRVDQAKSNFFDRKKVLDATTRAERKVLSRFGAFVRVRSRSSIKKAPKADAATGVILKGRRKKGAQTVDAVSKPGSPPYGHANQLLKKFLYFAYDKDAHSVVIGPAKLNQAIGNAPEALEYGTESTILIGKRRRQVRARIEARPYMQPAFDAELPKAAGLWKDSIK